MHIFTFVSEEIKIVLRVHEFNLQHEITLFLHKFGGKLLLNTPRPIYDRFLETTRYSHSLSTIVAAGKVFTSENCAVLLRTEFISNHGRQGVKVREGFILFFIDDKRLIFRLDFPSLRVYPSSQCRYASKFQNFAYGTITYTLVCFRQRLIFFLNFRK